MRLSTLCGLHRDTEHYILLSQILSILFCWKHGHITQDKILSPVWVNIIRSTYSIKSYFNSIFPFFLTISFYSLGQFEPFIYVVRSCYGEFQTTELAQAKRAGAQWVSTWPCCMWNHVKVMWYFKLVSKSCLSWELGSRQSHEEHVSSTL